jgi:Flp pilus assembly protein TadD
VATISEAVAIAFQYHERGQWAEAEAIYRQILDHQPEHADVLERLGVLALQTGRAAEAVTLLEKAAAVKPRDARIHGNLGAAYSVAGRHEDARVALEQAVRLDPSHAPAYANLGGVLYLLGQPEEAVPVYRRGLQLDANDASAHGNLGVALQDLGRLDLARTAYERAVELAPDQAIAHLNLGTLLKDQGQLAAAIESFERALAIEPGHGQALCVRGMAWLLLGDFARGWPGYEHRVGCPQFDTFRFGQPQWDGSRLVDRTLLVHCEQGLGDTLQFIRYVKPAADRAEKIIIAAQPALIPLLTESGFTGLVSRTAPLPHFDVHAPLMSLPNIFHTSAATIPCDVPYLAVDHKRKTRWRERLSEYRGLKVGIAWQGRKQFRGDRLRSIPLEHFAPLARVANVRLFNLQKGPGIEQLAALAERFDVVDLTGEMDNDGAFLDTAAVMDSLDLVVTSDTAMAHLAGALGAKVWVALSRVPDWRWLLEGTTSPWYPTMRVFRQQAPGDWPGVFAAIVAELAPLAEEAA